MDAGIPNVTILLLAVLALAIVVMLVALRKVVALSSAKAKARRFDRELEKYRQRYLVLETHAIDYSTALSARKDNLMVELHNSLQELEKRIDTVMDLVDEKNTMALRLANKLFNGKIIPPAEAAKGSLDEVPWKDYLEKLMQAVGEAIYNASQSSREIGLGGRGKRDTFVSLKEAGINLDEIRSHLEDEAS